MGKSEKKTKLSFKKHCDLKSPGSHGVDEEIPTEGMVQKWTTHRLIKTIDAYGTNDRRPGGGRPKLVRITTSPSCRTWSAVRTTKLCILFHVAPPIVAYF